MAELRTPDFTANEADLIDDNTPLAEGEDEQHRSAPAANPQGDDADALAPATMVEVTADEIIQYCLPWAHPELEVADQDTQYTPEVDGDLVVVRCRPPAQLGPQYTAYFENPYTGFLFPEMSHTTRHRGPLKILKKRRDTLHWDETYDGQLLTGSQQAGVWFQVAGYRKERPTIANYPTKSSYRHVCRVWVEIAFLDGYDFYFAKAYDGRQGIQCSVVATKAAAAPYRDAMRMWGAQDPIKRFTSTVFGKDIEIGLCDEQDTTHFKLSSNVVLKVFVTDHICLQDGWQRSWEIVEVHNFVCAKMLYNRRKLTQPTKPLPEE